VHTILLSVNIDTKNCDFFDLGGQHKAQSNKSEKFFAF
jgi:hypothetical protein